MKEEARKAFDKIDREVSLRYWNKQGLPMSLADWVEKFEDINYKRIASYSNFFMHISTVWLGLDHSFSFCSDEHRILIFETMIFMRFERSNLDQYQERYSTLEQAQEGHKRLVNKYWWRII